MVINLLHQLQKENNTPSREKKKKGGGITSPSSFFCSMFTIIGLETKVDDCPAHDQNVVLRIVFI